MHGIDEPHPVAGPRRGQTDPNGCSPQVGGKQRLGVSLHVQRDLAGPSLEGGPKAPEDSEAGSWLEDDYLVHCGVVLQDLGRGGLGDPHHPAGGSISLQRHGHRKSMYHVPDAREEDDAHTVRPGEAGSGTGSGRAHSPASPTGSASMRKREGPSWVRPFTWIWNLYWPVSGKMTS